MWKDEFIGNFRDVLQKLGTTEEMIEMCLQHVEYLVNLATLKLRMEVQWLSNLQEFEKEQETKQRTASKTAGKRDGLRERFDKLKRDIIIIRKSSESPEVKKIYNELPSEYRNFIENKSDLPRKNSKTIRKMRKAFLEMIAAAFREKQDKAASANQPSDASSQDETSKNASPEGAPARNEGGSKEGNAGTSEGFPLGIMFMYIGFLGCFPIPKKEGQPHPTLEPSSPETNPTKATDQSAEEILLSLEPNQIERMVANILQGAFDNQPGTLGEMLLESMLSLEPIEMAIAALVLANPIYARIIDLLKLQIWKFIIRKILIAQIESGITRNQQVQNQPSSPETSELEFLEDHDNIQHACQDIQEYLNDELFQRLLKEESILAVYYPSWKNLITLLLEDDKPTRSKIVSSGSPAQNESQPEKGPLENPDLTEPIQKLKEMFVNLKQVHQNQASQNEATGSGRATAQDAPRGRAPRRSGARGNNRTAGNASGKRARKN